MSNVAANAGLDTHDQSDNVTTSLAQGMQYDREEDTRSCPHDCHGHLELSEDDVPICATCRCSPEGVYYPPDTYSGGQIEPRGTVLRARNPHHRASRSTLHPWANDERERYRGSNAIILPGGFEDAWPQEMTTRDDSII